MYTKDEVLDFIEEEDVKFIRLAFFDLKGKQKNISIMPTELGRAFEHGIPFDASAIEGFENPQKSELYLKPDPSTLAIIPWRPATGKVVRMFCNILTPDGSPYLKDSRTILQKACQQLKDECGVEMMVGTEVEFYIFKLDEKGEPTSETFDKAGYMDIAPEDHGENIRREICFTLEQMGITPEASHHEEGPGQNEIDFHYSDALTAADNVATFKWIVNTKAASNGLYADFSPKPIVGQAGNGCGPPDPQRPGIPPPAPGAPSGEHRHTAAAGPHCPRRPFWASGNSSGRRNRCTCSAPRPGRHPSGRAGFYRPAHILRRWVHPGSR